MEKAIELIEQQQTAMKGRGPAFYVGEQLKDILRDGGPGAARVVAQDLEQEGMGLADCEKKIAEYAQAHRSGNCGVCPPQEAERIIRKFYGLEKLEERPRRSISLAEYL